MNVLQRAARTALQCCCRLLHTQTVTSSAADATAGLTALRATSRFLREADVDARPRVSGTLKGQAPSGEASIHGSCMLTSGQEAVLLQRSEIWRMLTMSRQPPQATACSSFTDAPAGTMYADSVRRKRKTKMNKHKHRKRLKKMRHGSK